MHRCLLIWAGGREVGVPIARRRFRVGPLDPEDSSTVGATGFEPAAIGTQSRRSSKLSYAPRVAIGHGRGDSNSRMTVLETAALAAELRPSRGVASRPPRPGMGVAVGAIGGEPRSCG